LRDKGSARRPNRGPRGPGRADQGTWARKSRRRRASWRRSDRHPDGDRDRNGDWHHDRDGGPDGHRHGYCYVHASDFRDADDDGNGDRNKHRDRHGDTNKHRIPNRDGNANRNRNRYADCDENRNGYADCEHNTDSDDHSNSDGYPNGNRHTNRDRNTDRDGYPDRDGLANRDRNADRDGHPDCDGLANRDGNADSNGYPDFDRHADVQLDAHSDDNSHLHSDRHRDSDANAAWVADRLPLLSGVVDPDGDRHGSRFQLHLEQIRSRHCDNKYHCHGFDHASHQWHEERDRHEHVYEPLQSDGDEDGNRQRDGHGIPEWHADLRGYGDRNVHLPDDRDRHS
jgi:hypothetical protein